mmetsp:Transcript_39682/g.55347  ORF Transcript_39682/g.55347 Transcript_39682/m.55347 type:complete len:97 (-) Transcript_39682:101-391(-)
MTRPRRQKQQQNEREKKLTAMERNEKATMKQTMKELCVGVSLCPPRCPLFLLAYSRQRFGCLITSQGSSAWQTYLDQVKMYEAQTCKEYQQGAIVK